ncbi:MAG: CpsD/CapB family tyrosine-protein kinase [Panacagrimonas sp.]
MERIKQALDMARQARETGTMPTIPVGREFGGVPAGGASRTGTAQDAVGEFRVNYTQTRVEPLSADRLRRNRILTGKDHDDATSAYKILRTQVLQRLAASGGTTLAITSPGTGQGKTLTSINLAMSLAAKVDYTVLLVDLDMRRPSVHRYMGLTVEYGIGDLLTGAATITQVLVNPGIERMVILPGKDRVHNSSEMLASPRMSRLLTDLKTRYRSRLVIFDLPPVLVGDDALAIAPQMDAVLMVVDEGRTKKNEVTRSMQILKSSNVIGTALNRSRETVSDFY